MTYKAKYLKLICVLLALMMLFGCVPVSDTDDPGSNGGGLANDPVTDPEPDPKPEPVEIRIVAAGDNLLHNTLSFDSRLDGGGYDFSKLYANITPILENADIAFLNQEVMFTGQEGAYPSLAAPFEAADAVKNAGFNVLNMATNHSLDKGQKGLMASLEYAQGLGFDAILGAFADEESSQQLTVLEKQGISFGFLSYTYGTNGIPLPSDKPWMVSLIERDKIKADIEAISPLCDYLIVSMHWGNEYQTYASDEQKSLAQFLCDSGVDLIIGHHPHVIQPVEVLTSASGHETVCVYSLGNFISGQHKRSTMLGGMLDMTVVFDGEGGFSVKSLGVIPVVTHFITNTTGFAVYPLSQYNEELAVAHVIKTWDEPASVNYFTGLAQEVLGEYIYMWEPET